MNEETSLIPPLTVGALSQYLRQTLEGQFGHVRVQGELSGVKRHTSGHIYFSLRDTDASLDGVCWRGVAQKLAVQPQEGASVVATGKITTYPGRSKYQIMVTHLEYAGLGAILQQIEALKKKLAAEGLFDPSRKKPLPKYPTRIGVITSATGAVIKDILHRLEDRYPVDVVLWPVLVQGEGATSQIVQALEGMDQLSPDLKPDLVILARGGGSVEDLMAFNDEGVVRAVAGLKLPIITAIGHETDVTLVDFAGDVRAPTPTGAAEMSTPVAFELKRSLVEGGNRLAQGLMRNIKLHHTTLEGILHRLGQYPDRLKLREQQVDDLGSRLATAGRYYLSKVENSLKQVESQLRPPISIINQQKQELSYFYKAITLSFSSLVERHKVNLEGTIRLLGSLSYKSTLKRGYVIVKQKHFVTHKAALDAGKPLTLTFQDGEATLGANEVRSKSSKTQKKETSSSQGALF